MRIFGFLDQKRSKTIQILSQNFDCYGVIKELENSDLNLAGGLPAELLYDPIAVKILVGFSAFSAFSEFSFLALKTEFFEVKNTTKKWKTASV